MGKSPFMINDLLSQGGSRSHGAVMRHLMNGYASDAIYHLGGAVALDGTGGRIKTFWHTPSRTA